MREAPSGQREQQSEGLFQGQHRGLQGLGVCWAMGQTHACAFTQCTIQQGLLSTYCVLGAS